MVEVDGVLNSPILAASYSGLISHGSGLLRL